MVQKKIIIYLDHNVLDFMTKDNTAKIKNWLLENNFTPVYSNETLKEINRSVGYEQDFLKLLEEISAKFLEPILDIKLKHTGQAKILCISPKVKYDEFLVNKWLIRHYL